jgi:hypothetical protein
MLIRAIEEQYYQRNQFRFYMDANRHTEIRNIGSNDKRLLFNLAQLLMPLTSLREMTGSNLGQDTYYPDRRLQSLEANFQFIINLIIIIIIIIIITPLDATYVVLGTDSIV